MLDSELHDTQQDQRGPIESELNEYGHNGRVLASVIGRYGDASSDLSLIMDLVARELARKHTAFCNIGFSEAKAMFKQELARKWGHAIAWPSWEGGLYFSTGQRITQKRAKISKAWPISKGKRFRDRKSIIHARKWSIRAILWVKRSRQWQASSSPLKQWQKRQAANPQLKVHGRSPKNRKAQ